MDRRTGWRAVSVAVAMGLAGCAASGIDMGMGAPKAVVPATPFTAAERDFVTRVAAKGMYEIEVSKLAAERAVNPNVRRYAQTMVTHHQQMNNELIALMSAHGVAPPQGLAADRANKLHRLAALPPSDGFDNGYVRVVGVEDHQAAIAMFDKARRTLRDRDLRAWVDRSIDTMREHLRMAQNLAGQLAG